MKKIITISLILISCLSFNAIAQPVITNAYNPIFGDVYVYKIVADTSSAQPGNAGANVTWNLTSMHGQLTTRQYNWKQTALTNDAAIFGANSNIASEGVQNGLPTWYEYYDVGSAFTGDFKYVGSHVQNAITNYRGGYMLIDYPLSYGQSCDDSIASDTTVSFTQGVVTTTYDGYGTLQLEPQSGGNFTNVARIKIVSDYEVNYGPVETHHEETYLWYDHTTTLMKKQPILMIKIHEWVDLNGTTQREKFAGIRQVLFQNEVPKLNLNSSNVSVSPNPFQDKISFSLPGMNSEISIQICDVTGRVVKNILLEKSVANREETISLSDLPQGIYLAKVSSDNGSVVKRIVKE